MSDIEIVVGATPEGVIVGIENPNPVLVQDEDDDFDGEFRQDPREQEREFYKLRSGVMPISHHRRYMRQGGGCADNLDQTMRELFTDPQDGVDRPALEATARLNEVWNERWASLNNGMVRMNLANRLRGRARHGKEIVLVNAQGEILDRGRFGIAPTALQKQEEERLQAEQRKAEQEERNKIAAKHREERDAILEARKASNKPPQARIEQKLTEKRASKGKAKDTKPSMARALRPAKANA